MAKILVLDSRFPHEQLNGMYHIRGLKTPQPILKLTTTFRTGGFEEGDASSADGFDGVELVALIQGSALSGQLCSGKTADEPTSVARLLHSRVAIICSSDQFEHLVALEPQTVTRDVNFRFSECAGEFCRGLLAVEHRDRKTPPDKDATDMPANSTTELELHVKRFTSQLAFSTTLLCINLYQSLLKINTLSSFIAALFLTTVNAHGQMTKPTPRPISQQYRADCGALSGAGDQELQYAPVELLNSRAQSDRPAAANFNIMNGCRGTVYEANNTITELAAGTPFDVEWVIQAPHPGTMVLSIVKPSTDSSGTITYKSVVKLLTIDPFAENSGGNTSTTATIPPSVTGCGFAGDCALQFYWHSDLASQTYPTCADIVVTGSGDSNGQSSTSMEAPSATTATPLTTEDTPMITTASEIPTTTPATALPANDETDAPSESSTAPEKCTRRQRRLAKMLN